MSSYENTEVISSKVLGQSGHNKVTAGFFIRYIRKITQTSPGFWSAWVNLK